jgi:hypothetical protein
MVTIGVVPQESNKFSCISVIVDTESVSTDSVNLSTYTVGPGGRATSLFSSSEALLLPRVFVDRCKTDGHNSTLQGKFS